MIAGHNYTTHHFGTLYELEEGDKVIFTDMDGVVTHYQVVALDILQPTAVEEMTAGAYDLTLFTCTYDSGTCCCRAVACAPPPSLQTILPCSGHSGKKKALVFVSSPAMAFISSSVSAKSNTSRFWIILSLWVGLRKHDHASLNIPAEHHLRGCFAILFADLLQYLVVKKSPPRPSPKGAQAS